MTTASSSLTEAQQSLVAYMEGMKRVKGAMHVAREFLYHGMEHFLLEHGSWHETQPWDDTSYLRGIPRQCFRNSLMASAEHDGLRYVEGLACTTGLVSFPIYHAWNLDRAGRVVDLTWQNEGLLYFGVEFSTSRAMKTLTQGSTVLDDYGRGHPLYRKPWTGEKKGGRK